MITFIFVVAILILIFCGRAAAKAWLKFWLLLAAFLVGLVFVIGFSGAAVACDEIALDLIGNDKDFCEYRARETGIEWELSKKEMTAWKGTEHCPLVLMAGDL